MLKLLFLTHRYLGIGLGFVMLLWCLSGFVMMYKPYPELNQQEQLATLPPLDLTGCCTVPAKPGESGESGQFRELGGFRESGEASSWSFPSFYIQTIGEQPVLTLNGAGGDYWRFDLRGAAAMLPVDHDKA